MRTRRKTEFMEWMDATLVADPELARAVEERMAEMRIEQERFGIREKERKAALRTCRSRFMGLLRKSEDQADRRDVRAAGREARRKGTIPWEKAKAELGPKYAPPLAMGVDAVDPLDEVPLELPDLQLSGRFTCLAAPVQAEGTIAGHAFYFRARHSSWRFAIANGQEPDPVRVRRASKGFLLYSEIRGPGEHPASHITIQQAVELIQRAARKFLQTRSMLR